MLHRPSYASVAATLALFLSLGGGAYAAATLPANSVGAKQLKKSAVERGKLKKNAVDSSKILDNSVSGDDVKESTLTKVPAATLADTATSATNATHATSSGALDKVVYKAAAQTAPATGGNVATATCDAGSHVIGGGVKVDDPFNAFVVDSYPDGGNTAWSARVGNSGASPVNFTVYAICASIGAVG